MIWNILLVAYNTISEISIRIKWKIRTLNQHYFLSLSFCKSKIIKNKENYFEIVEIGSTEYNEI